MRKIFTLLFSAALLSNVAFGQTPIPNGDFENWGNSSGADRPDSWSTSDQIVTGLPFGLSSPGGISQETNPANVASGTSSALLTTLGVNIPTVGDITFAGSMSIGAYGFKLSGFQVTLGGVAYTDRPDSIEFLYKHEVPAGGSDQGVVTVDLTRATPHDGTVTVGSATVYLDNTSGFQTAKAKINYYSALAPDTLKMQAQSSASLFVDGTRGAKLWLDDMRFKGYDTIFKAYLFPKVGFIQCEGDDIIIRTDEIPGDTYTWFLDGMTLPYRTYKITAPASGEYSVLVSHSGALYVSDTITMTIHPLPAVIYSSSQDTVCDHGSVVQLSGGFPSGGSYSGRGVSGSIFDPNNVPIGDRHIVYTYTDTNGCTSTSDNLAFYVAGCSVGIDELLNTAQVSVYPTPATNTLFITGNEQIVNGTVRIYDVQGRVVHITGILATDTSINLSTVGAGWYTVLISDASNTLLAKSKVVVVK